MGKDYSITDGAADFFDGLFSGVNRAEADLIAWQAEQDEEGTA